MSANAQSAGRGRQGRSWASPAGAGLYVSTILKPAQHALSLLTIAAGVAVADGIHAATGLVPDLKWPNDVFISGRKAAGVLAEAASSGARTYVVLGFGINVLPAAYPPEVAPRATNLEREVGRAVDRGLLLAECLCSLAARYQDLESGRIESVVDAWRGHAGRDPRASRPVARCRRSARRCCGHHRRGRCARGAHEHGPRTDYDW